MLVCFWAGIFKTGVDIEELFEGAKAGEGEDIDLDKEEAGIDICVLMFPVDTGGVDDFDGELNTALIGRGFS